MTETLYDAPNQQVVRADGSGPGIDSEPAPEPKDGAQDPSDETAALDAMTKAELLAYAQQLGVSPANNDMTKDELRAGIDAKLAEAPG